MAAKASAKRYRIFLWELQHFHRVCCSALKNGQNVMKPEHLQPLMREWPDGYSRITCGVFGLCRLSEELLIKYRGAEKINWSSSLAWGPGVEGLQSKVDECSSHPLEITGQTIWDMNKPGTHFPRNDVVLHISLTHLLYVMVWILGSICSFWNCLRTTFWHATQFLK